MVESGPADSETFLFRTELPQAQFRDKERKTAEQKNPTGCFPVSSEARENGEVTFRVVAGSLL